MTDQEIIDKIIEMDRSWNVAIICQGMMEILRARGGFTVADIERLFRKQGCQLTYLVAWPVEYIPSNLRPMALDGSTPDYGLWICINGLEDQARQLEEFGLTVETNMIALEKAGIGVCPK